METRWWDQMDLGPWCTDAPADAVGMGFAQAIAAERVQRRGTRQRITAGHRTPTGRPHLRVEDVPAVVEEPCS